MAAYQNPVSLLQELIRFDTTNPPGHEAECIKYISGIFESVGLTAKIIGKSPKRKNLIVRLEGQGNAPPLLAYGHADVVTVEHQQWTHPPFEGVLADGYVWGRGALDMKGPLAMMITALIRAREEGFKPQGDIILAVVCDEEDEGDYGARFLVEEHAELFRGVRYAIGEIGGFTMHLNNKRFYPVMVSEKQKCSLRAVLRGPSGHGSIPVRNGAMAKLGRILSRLNGNRLPVHIVPAAGQMVRALASNLPFPGNLVLKQLLNPLMTDHILDFMGDKGSFFDPVFHNTVNATIVHGGNKINVVPSEAVVEFDGRLLPGFSPEDMIKELKTVAGSDIDFEVIRYIPGVQGMNMGLFDTLSAILRDVDNRAIPIPFIVSGVTDARYFSRLGIQTYGFTPMILPESENFTKLIHGADERISAEALTVGSNAIYELFRRYKEV